MEIWRGPRIQAVGLMTIIVATAFGIGFGVGQLLLVTGLGVLVGALMVGLVITRAPDAGNAASTTQA